MLDIRHTQYMTAMHLTACWSREQGSATQELLSFIVSYLPINVMVLLKSIQSFVLTEGTGIFQNFLVPLLQGNPNPGHTNESRHRFF